MSTPRKLRILHFAYDHPDNPWVGGGGAGRTWSVNKYLSERHDIRVYCGPFPDATPQDVPFKVRFTGEARRYVESRLKFMWEGRRVNAKPYDLIVEEFSFYAPILSHFSNRPTVTILQSRHGLKALRYHPAYGWLSLLSQYCVVRRKRAVILASEHLRPLIHPSARVAVIGQGADIPKDLPSPTEEYVLFLGRFDVRIKGLDILLKAWAKLPPNLSSMPLHLAGSGDEEGIHTLMRETGARNVHLVGRLDHSEAMAAIRRAAFICVPSRDEGSPLVVYEAFALGKPVIGSSIPALKPLIPDGIAGIQVPPGDPQALSKAIESLLVDRAMRSRLAEGALRVGKEYSWERVAERQEKFYWETIEGR